MHATNHAASAPVSVDGYMAVGGLDAYSYGSPTTAQLAGKAFYNLTESVLVLTQGMAPLNSI